MFGSFLSFLSPTFRRLIVKTLLQLTAFFYPPVDALLERLDDSPGTPVYNPSSSYWAQPPSPISQHNASPNVPLPEYADIVIIGSGITGTSVARTILDQKGGDGHRIVMLEARDTCSGATGRNGGHITPVLYQDYISLKETHGKDMAKKIIRFRLSHLTQLLAVAQEEGLLYDSQCRQVEAFDVFYNKALFRKAQGRLREYQKDLPEESANYRVYERPEQLAALHLSKECVGCLSTQAGAVHPYRLVTGILQRLLTSYQHNFDLYTHTPCTDIKAPGDDDHLYRVHTPRGVIRTPHIVHATNGWTSHLLPGMRGKIFPARGVMSAHTPPPGDVTWSSGWRSFVFYRGRRFGVYDYLTQQLSASSGGLSSAYPEADGEMMLGGGFTRAIVSEIGVADDSQCHRGVEDYLRKQALGTSFAAGEEGKVRSVWSGILGISADERPWVGRVCPEIAGRAAPSMQHTLAAPGEWIAAGYSGEGMVHAWMSGQALGQMLLGKDAETLPGAFKISRERWAEADFEGFVGLYLENEF